jgi:hypothetical protein
MPTSTSEQSNAPDDAPSTGETYGKPQAHVVRNGTDAAQRARRRKIGEMKAEARFTEKIG